LANLKKSILDECGVKYAWAKQEMGGKPNGNTALGNGCKWGVNIKVNLRVIL
jgi:hypothetical protein